MSYNKTATSAYIILCSDLTKKCNRKHTGKHGNYLRIHMIFKGKEDWKGWCLKCTFSNSFYYFLKNQNTYSYKFMSLKKQHFVFEDGKDPKRSEIMPKLPEIRPSILNIPESSWCSFAATKFFNLNCNQISKMSDEPQALHFPRNDLCLPKSIV